MTHIKGFVEGEARGVEYFLYRLKAFLGDVFRYMRLALRIEIEACPYLQFLVIGIIFGEEAWKVQGRPRASK